MGTHGVSTPFGAPLGSTPSRSPVPLRTALSAIGAGAGLLLAIALGAPAGPVAVVAALTVLVVTIGGRALAWPAQLGVVLAVVMFLPIRRYELPVELPFELEPYRILLALVAAAWVSSLLIDDDVRLRRSGFEAPIALFGLAIIGSLALNIDRASAVQADVIKSVLFFASFFVLFFAIVSLVRDQRAVQALLGVLVLGGAIVAVFALIEARTGWNAFAQLDRVIPGLEHAAETRERARGGRLRVLASAQHPIALGAALVVLLPLALSLARTAKSSIWRWLIWAAFGLIGLAALATVSRTAFVMLLAALVAFLVLRPRPTARMLAVGLVPALAAVHLLLPGTIGALWKSFRPEGGLIAEQSTSVGTRGQGRVADLGPAMQELAQDPVLGQGFGTRIVEAGRENSQILDNQWLGVLLETGIVGVVAFAWLIIAALVVFGRAARRDRGPVGALMTGITASVASFGVGMFFFDAFAFIQVTLIFFAVLALGVCASRLANAGGDGPGGAPRPHRVT